MTNIFLGSESMEHQLSNALSTMFLRHLVLFLHFETYALPNPQKKYFSGGSGVQLDFLPHIETIWPAWIFELGLLKFSHFVSNFLRNVENDVQIFQFRLDEHLDLPEKLIFEGVFCRNIFVNSFFRKSTLAIFFRYPFEVLLFVMETCEVKYDRYFSYT